jgi:hypothetical protein
MPSPSYVPLIRTGVDVTFNTVTVTGLNVGTGGITVAVGGFTALQAAQTAGDFTCFGGNLILGSAGTTLKIKEGANCTMGVATLVGGTVTVNTSKVSATSRIQLTPQSLGTVTAPKAVAVTARTPGTSFVITSADATDTSVIAWEIHEPAP